jgi:hypothetical protein
MADIASGSPDGLEDVAQCQILRFRHEHHLRSGDHIRPVQGINQLYCAPANEYDPEKAHYEEQHHEFAREQASEIHCKGDHNQADKHSRPDQRDFLDLQGHALLCSWT